VEIREWFAALRDSKTVFFIPEIADYEVRRSFILENLNGSLASLDGLASLASYAPITTEDMRLAAMLWAQSRKTGRSIGDPKELNADVILAAQAIRLGAVIATDNIGHLDQFTPAKRWTEIRA
jgi:predicted nucleic acid-binding protein